jgi:Zn-finger nucleic acid-binding protein
MRCPVCKDNTLGEITLLERLPARQCTNCAGVSIPSNAYMTWRRTLGREFPPKEGAIEIDPMWEVKELKFCPDCGHIMARYKIFPDTDFYIDRCRSCNGIWLDQNEWDVLIDRNFSPALFRRISAPRKPKTIWTRSTWKNLARTITKTSSKSASG